VIAKIAVRVHPLELFDGSLQNGELDVIHACPCETRFRWLFSIILLVPHLFWPSGARQRTSLALGGGELQEENRVLKGRLGGRHIRFSDAERRRLACKAQALGRKVLNELETLVSPDTLSRWYRELVASITSGITPTGAARADRV
jgi:hypothetical protein